MGKAIGRIAPKLRHVDIRARFDRGSGRGRSHSIKLDKLLILPSEMPKASEDGSNDTTPDVFFGYVGRFGQQYSTLFLRVVVLTR
jgi:hypothetical protein